MDCHGPTETAVCIDVLCPLVIGTSRCNIMYLPRTVVLRTVVIARCNIMYVVVLSSPSPSPSPSYVVQ